MFKYIVLKNKQTFGEPLSVKIGVQCVHMLSFCISKYNKKCVTDTDALTYLHLDKSPAGVAKSNVRVARVVHLLVWATDFFQLSCPWTTSRVEEYKKYIVIKFYKTGC